MRECDNKSVGVIVQNEGDTLLIERARFPWGWAAPAGHIDEHGTPEDAAVTEVFEETGLVIPVSALELVIDGRRVDMACRRPGGDYHDWTVYRAESDTRETVASPDETTGLQWAAPSELNELIKRTEAVRPEEVQRGDQVLEHIWMEYFVELGIPNQ